MNKILLIETPKHIFKDLKGILEILWSIEVDQLKENKVRVLNLSKYQAILMPDDSTLSLATNISSELIVKYNPKNINMTDIIVDLTELLGYTNLDRDYRKVLISTFYRHKHTKADLYVKLGDSKYVKVFNKNNSMSDLSIVMDRMKSRKLTHLYFTKPDYHKFITNMTRSLTSREAFKFSKVEDSVEKLTIVTQELGIYPSTKRIVSEITKSITEQLDKVNTKDKNIQQVLIELKRLESPLKLTSYIATHLCKSLGWTSHKTYKKILSAIVLQNLELAPELQRYTSLEVALANEEVTPEQVKEIKLHPLKSAELTYKMGDLFKDTATIIEQHHERPNGSGYPRGLRASKITPLSAVFIISSDIANAMCEGKYATWDELVRTLTRQYSVNPFKKYFHFLINGEG